MTELITNTAAAALLVPIATSGAEALGVSPRPFYLAIMFAVCVTQNVLLFVVSFIRNCYTRVLSCSYVAVALLRLHQVL